MGDNNLSPRQSPGKARLSWVCDLLLILILLSGAYFRITGLNWDQNQHLHPDERFLTMVEAAVSPVKDLSQYFDTQNSSLNPNNRGYGFYVYGDLPLFMVRYVGEWLGQTGYDQIHLVGRQLSALMDLGTVLLVYLIANQLYRKQIISLLAAAFAAFSVLPIQLSHYFTVDTFTNFFGMIALLCAVMILPLDNWRKGFPALTGRENPNTHWLTYAWTSVIPYVFFGLALGLAMASKINAVFLAALLPGAVLIRFLSQPSEERRLWVGIYLRNLVIAGIVSVIVFRIFQPYAFSGPGFFGMLPNQKWLDQIRELANQSTGDVDFPPALQWARRPMTFALTNMVEWGLGLPLGILAWAGFLWMAVRIFRGEWRQHVLIWAWTAFYFAYQSYNFVRSMRYQMLVYPTLAIIAAWAVAMLWEKRALTARSVRIPWTRITAGVIGLVVVVSTAAWAFAFTRIYTRPVTRVAASQWIYQNVPGPINLHIQGNAGLMNQPVAFRSGYDLQSGQPPLAMAFRPRQAGQLKEVTFEHLGSSNNDQSRKTLSVALSETPNGAQPLTSALLADTFPVQDDPRGKNYTANFLLPVTLDPAKTYYLVFSMASSSQDLNLSGSVALTIQTEQTTIHQQLPEPVNALRAGQWYQISFTPVVGGLMNEMVLQHVVDWEARPDQKTLRVSILDPGSGSLFGVGEIRSVFAPSTDIRGAAYTIKFADPVELRAHQTYAVRLELVDGAGALAVYGSQQANESSWDDALPLSLDGYNPYDYSTGVYRSDLNFEMYWDDNADKLQRFESTLNQADYIFISSNRQWGTTVRVPERYPLTTEYYRDLIGCPAGKEITWCYSVAQPGMFKGNLGFELTAVFQSDPNLGSLRFNDQFAEEAFTVYDHPKVLIFKKTADYDADKVQALLESVDLTKVIHLTPRKAALSPANLMLPPDRLSGQRAGGTWADLFHPDALYNRYPFLAALFWYGVIALLGFTVYPFTRLALHGLPDRGYPFTRLVGILALAYPVWLLGSYKVPFTPLTISLVFAVLLLLNLALAYQQRKILRIELRERWKYILLIEGLLLAFFMLFLLVRLGNPDLWHPWKGGEKPMDFAYFNAVLKSTTFPPYDPWFAGGYINYYYYGFILIGVPVKWLGIVPSIAYNLILPTLFALLAIGAFSIGWNLLSATRPRRILPVGIPSFEDASLFTRKGPFFGGLSAAVAVTVLGNWGTMRMVWWGLQRLADMQVPFETAPILTRIIWAVTGLIRLITVPGTVLPYSPTDWYWIPSRASVILGKTVWDITEFPAFTFLYGDPHAHMIALPVTVLALAWALSVILGRWGWMGWGHLSVSFLLGGLTIGALRPTNTWDWPTYLALGCLAVAYTALRYGQACCLVIPKVGVKLKRVLIAITAPAALIVLSALLYQPFASWFMQGYTRFEPWTGYRIQFSSYMTHWGVFLFIIISWMIWESIDWMASTPATALNRLRSYTWLILPGLLGLIMMVVVLLLMGVQISWLVLPLLVWAGVLLLRPGMHDARRAVLFLFGTALFLTLFVELFHLQGDVDRMNTIFKFYLQAWVLMAISAAACLVWLLPAVSQLWHPKWQRVWEPALMVLIFGAALFPWMAGMGKIRDRMASNAPHTLDGMTYMAYSTYQEGDKVLDLSQDYRAIQWMQRSVSGSPVIVEGSTGEYNWGSRFSIYTGLPDVVGWNWHQRQQRGVVSDAWVWERVEAIKAFYNTFSRADTETFLRRYAVSYIVVGQLERAIYPPVGLQKFADWNGDLWHEVYRDGQTVIYQVSLSY